MKNKYTQEDLDKALDKIKQGPIGKRKDHHWDSAERMKYIRDNIAPEKLKELARNTSERQKGKRIEHLLTPEVRAKQAVSISKALKGRKCTWTEKISKSKKQADFVAQPKKRKAIFSYKGEVKTFHESIIQAAKDLKIPRVGIEHTLNGYQSSTNGYTFEYVSGPKQVFTVQEVKSMKKRYREDTTITAKILAKDYNVGYHFINYALTNDKHYNSGKYGQPLTLRKHPIYTCTHCGYQGGGPNFSKNHENNCSNKQ